MFRFYVLLAAVSTAGALTGQEPCPPNYYLTRKGGVCAGPGITSWITEIVYRAPRGPTHLRAGQNSAQNVLEVRF